MNSLSSAREQVEKTVKSSNELQKIVGEYVAIVRTFCDSLKKYEDYLNDWEDNLRTRETSLGHEIESAIANIERSCSTVITMFNTKVDDIKNSFQTETKKTLDSFIEENKKLSKFVADLNSLRTQIEEISDEIQLVKITLDQLSKDLNDSQDEQDEVLNDIQQKVTNLSSFVHEEAISIIKAIADSETTLKEAISTTSAKIEELIVKTNTLESRIDILHVLCRDIYTFVNSSIANLENVIIASKDEIIDMLISEVGKVNSSIASLKVLSEKIVTSIELFSGQVVPVLISLKETAQMHHDVIIKELEEQERRLNTKLDALKKQNKLFLIVIILILIAIVGLEIFNS